MNIEKFIKMARKEAEKSRSPKYRMGAVIVKGNRVIGRGRNRLSGKMNRFERRFQMTLFSLHSEMASLLDCDEDLTGATMFVAGIREDGSNVYSRPCKRCLKILRHTEIKTVYYSTENEVEAIYLGKDV